jgi:hypothetical protein
MRIGKIVPVALREIWKNEANDFTSWLAQNLEALSETLDLSIEFIEQERRVDDSRFCIDIWAEDEEGNSVIIENQLEKTDHTHLGQILTYAVNVEAKTIIWITKESRQEHIAAIDWLNKFSEKKFFLVQLSAIKIGDSDPAPQFSVICRPSPEMKVIGRGKIVMDDVMEARRKRRAVSDTLIVPARKEGFERVFLGENAWYSIRLQEQRIPQIKYVAGYQVAPISAVTHLAEVAEIVRSHEDPTKYKVIFKGAAKTIKPIPLGNAQIQCPVYCESSKLLKSKDIAEALSADDYKKSEAA